MPPRMPRPAELGSRQRHSRAPLSPTTMMHDLETDATGEPVAAAATTATATAATSAADTPGACTCGCGVVVDADGRRAVAVDPNARTRNLKRLRRIEGQVRGLQKMIETDRYCADVMTQVSAVQEALRAVSRELLRNHLTYCATTALRGTPEQAAGMVDELVDLVARQGR